MSDGASNILCGTIILFCGLVAGEGEYCKIWCNGALHTMCKYKARGPPHCQGYETGISATEKRMIVKIHNELRQKIALGEEENSPQPPAANMQVMSWDPELATIAQRWADQCTATGHDHCRTTLKGEIVGQNVAEGSGDTMACKRIFRPSIFEAITAWYEEVNDFSNETVGAYMSTGTDHYAQIVWANTTRVGCGANQFCVGYSVYFKFICNYVPSGSYKGQPVYVEGEPCTRCPKGTTCSTKWKGLCAPI